MARFTKSTAFGYKDVPGGHSDYECSHVILTLDEYNKSLQQIRVAEYNARTSADNAEKLVARAKRDANAKITAAENESEKAIEAAAVEIAEAQAETERYKKLNQNLIRIAKERANSDRKLKPKKEHTGYVVLNSRGSDYKYKVDRYSWAVTELWETILQTPYRVEFTEEQIRLLIEELFENDNEIISKIGITAKVIGDYEDITDTPRYIEELQYKNFVMKQHLRANYVTGYWEVILKHTSPLVNVPKDMMRCSYS